MSQRSLRPRDSISLGSAMGTGCFGSVYRGTYKGETVAVKVVTEEETETNGGGGGTIGRSLAAAMGRLAAFSKIKTENQKKICAEAQMMMEFDHPNIVPCLKYLLRPTWIVMELCTMNLHAFFTRKLWQMANEERLDLMGQVNGGLVVIHARGIVHRDIKANNVMVKSDESRQFRVVYKIGDFGLASRESDNAGESQFKAYQKYRAPELRDGQCTTKVDMWNLGLVFYSLHVRGVQQGARRIPRGNIDQFLGEVKGVRLKYALTGLLDDNADGRMSSESLAKFLGSIKRKSETATAKGPDLVMAEEENRTIMEGSSAA